MTTPITDVGEGLECFSSVRSTYYGYDVLQTHGSGSVPNMNMGALVNGNMD